MLRRGGGDAVGCCRKTGLGKSLVKIKRQNIVPVGRHAEIGVRLPRSGADYPEEFLFFDRMNPLDRQRSHARLFPFLHRETDKHIAFFAFVIVCDLPLDPGIEKAICLVQIAHRLCVGIHQLPAEASR